MGALMRALVWLACAAFVVLAPGAAAANEITPAASGSVAFEVYMNGGRVGRHAIDVVQTGSGETRADVRIDLAGRVGPFSFTYAHRCAETWRGQTLQSLACEDREGRKVRRLSAQSAGDRLALDVNGRGSTAPLGALPSTWWRASTAKATALLDTRNGKMLTVRVRMVGRETLMAPDGPVEATRYRLEGSTSADLWYDGAGRFVKMAFRLRGQSFEYKLATPAAAAPIG
jgi:hypothetical protein